MNRMSNLQPPATHDVRRESRRRLMVGFSGLLAMLLLVLLAGLVTDRARKEADAAVAQAQAAGVANPGTPADATGNEPLADVGVAPTVESSGSPAVAPVEPAASPPTTSNGRVPDLQPDPRLETQKSIR